MIDLLLFGIVVFVWLVSVAGTGAIVGLVAWHITRPATRPMVPAFAAQMGYALISMLAVLILSVIGMGGMRKAGVTLLTIQGFIAVLVWLLLRPGRVSVLLLTAFHIVDFSMACLLFLTLEGKDGAAYGGLLAGLLIRIVSIVLMVAGLQSIVRIRSQVAPEPEPSSTL